MPNTWLNPSQVGQAPNGLLKENRFGTGSSNFIPSSSNRLEKGNCFSSFISSNHLSFAFIKSCTNRIGHSMLIIFIKFFYHQPVDQVHMFLCVGFQRFSDSSRSSIRHRLSPVSYKLENPFCNKYIQFFLWLAVCMLPEMEPELRTLSPVFKSTDGFYHICHIIFFYFPARNRGNCFSDPGK